MQRRGLLDKYDEQDEAMGVVTLGAGGSTRLSEEDQRAKRQADMRAKLAEGKRELRKWQ